MGGPSAKYGGVINQLWGGISQVWGGISQVWGAISQVWGGHQPTMGGPSAKYGGVINQLWGGISQVWGGIFPPVCTGSQNPENYFSNTYVLPSVNRTAGPKIQYQLCKGHRNRTFFSCIKSNSTFLYLAFEHPIFEEINLCDKSCT